MFSKQNYVSIAKISTFSEKTKKLVKKLCSFQSIILTLQTEKKHLAKRDAFSEEGRKSEEWDVFSLKDGKI